MDDDFLGLLVWLLPIIIAGLVFGENGNVINETGGN